MGRKIVLGTRGSELALKQARLVEDAIRARRTDVEIEKKIIATRGDRTKIVDARAGWKGLFTAEIERALIAGDIDVAVHSAKDLPSETDARTAIAAVLPRAAAGDVLISKHKGGLAGLRKGAIVATSSVRRTFQLRWQRRDLAIVDLRQHTHRRITIHLQQSQKLPLRSQTKQRFTIVGRIDNRFGLLVIVANLQGHNSLPARRKKHFARERFDGEINRDTEAVDPSTREHNCIPLALRQFA